MAQFKSNWLFKFTYLAVIIVSIVLSDYNISETQHLLTLAPLAKDVL